MLLLIVGILLFVGLVVVHEYGHFIAARRNGVDIEEFGIGFPPKVWGRKTKGGWLFSINLLPLGGFVRLKGEHDADTAKGTFGAAPLMAKTKIMAAGVFLNLVTALVLLTALAWIGMPQIIDNQFTVKSDTKVIPAAVVVEEVEKGSPAAQAGIQEGDSILAIGAPGREEKLASPQDLPAITKKNAGDKVSVRYLHDGQEKTATTTLRTEGVVEESRKTDDPKGYLGIVPDAGFIAKQRSTWSAPVVAVGLTAQFTQLTFEGLGRALAGLGSAIAGTVTGNTEARQDGQKRAAEQVSGPVGIF
jgi:regulator of sigma E protease